MAKLIDANVVLAKQFTSGLSDVSGNYYGYADVVFVDDIENAPAVDAVEVVRCKDCKHGMKSHLQPRHTKNYLCRHSWEGEYHEPDHFCSYGERKAE